MKYYTAKEYLYIDIANQFGMDKKVFEERIEWTEQSLSMLESLTDKADCKPLYVKAVQALRDAERGIPIGHLVGLDASASGIQMLSVLTGCKEGCNNTGLIDPDVRADAYSTLTKYMQKELGPDFDVSRADAKEALMTVYYGSKKLPKVIFGEETPELAAFYVAAKDIAPGPFQLLDILIKSWNSYATEHTWTMPDGFEVRNKVYTKQEKRIEIDELDHATFTYEYYKNEGTDKGLANAANVAHSVDAYVLRSMHRRCNYDPEMINWSSQLIQETINMREVHNVGHIEDTCDDFYIEAAIGADIPDTYMLERINGTTVHYIPTEMLHQLLDIATSMLSHKPFPIVTIHDEFKAHPNNCNYMRMHYANIMADIADSCLLDTILTDLYDEVIIWEKPEKLGHLIRKSNYGIS